MQVQNAKSNTSTIRPVILAAARQRRLWPLSTPETPFFLRSINQRPALLVRCLQALEANPAFGSPIVVLSECAARLGISEVTRIRPDASIILVPEGVGSSISSLLAALETTASCNCTHLALIPANFFATDPVEAFACMASVVDHFSPTAQVSLMTSRSARSDSTIHVELGARLGKSPLFQVQKLHRIVASEMKEALRDANVLVSTAGPALVSTQSLIQHIQKSFPTTYVACHNAIKLAERYGKTYRPQADFLSFAGKPSIGEYFQTVLPDLLTFVGNPDWRTIETFRDPMFDELITHPNTPVAIAGPAGQRMISSSDGVLILNSGYEDLVKNYYPDISNTGVPGTGLRAKGPSLRFTA